jgi:Leucine-rich repeat (LRR) protein
MSTQQHLVTRLLLLLLCANDRLTKVDLMDNKLTAIPESIQLLKYLRTLDLQNNRLKRLHEFFATLVSLDELKISGNENIKGITQETIKLGDSEVIATVQQLPKIIDRSWRTKLLVTGAGSV